MMSRDPTVNEQLHSPGDSQLHTCASQQVVASKCIWHARRCSAVQPAHPCCLHALRTRLSLCVVQLNSDNNRLIDHVMDIHNRFGIDLEAEAAGTSAPLHCACLTVFGST